MLGLWKADDSSLLSIPRGLKAYIEVLLLNCNEIGAYAMGMRNSDSGGGKTFIIIFAKANGVIQSHRTKVKITVEPEAHHNILIYNKSLVNILKIFSSLSMIWRPWELKAYLWCI